MTFRFLFEGISITAWRLAHQGVGVVAKWLLSQITHRVWGTPVLRHSRVTPYLYVGGRVSGLGWRRLHAAGVDAIVNMRQEQPLEKRDVTPAAYLCLPTPDNHAPTLEQLEQGSAFMADAIGQKRGVYVHCASGVGRAPTMAAAYLLTTGLSLDEALAAIRRTRPFIRLNRLQIEQLARFAARQNSQGQASQ